MNGTEAALFTQIYQILGFPATLLLLYWLASKWMRDQRAKVDADRKEHINKWNTMINANKQAMDRMFELYDRNASTNERNGHNIAEMKEKLNSIHSDIKAGARI